jgi:hypothetical protein
MRNIPIRQIILHAQVMAQIHPANPSPGVRLFPHFGIPFNECQDDLVARADFSLIVASE